MKFDARTVLKAASWQITGLFVMSIIGYVVTGSVSTGGSIAVSGAVIGFVMYILHEMVWNRIEWGRREHRTGTAAASTPTTP